MNTREFYFQDGTPQRVKDVINFQYESQARLRIWYGDKRTGKAWLEEYEVIGHIGRSTGTQPIPLLVHNARSMGGGSILTSCIVRIVAISSGKELYRHDTYNNPAARAVIVPTTGQFLEAVTIDGEIHALFEKAGQAQKWIDFMTGKRFSK